jgi:lipoate-protein ligase A
MSLQTQNVISTLSVFPMLKFNWPTHGKYFAAVVISKFTNPYFNLSIDTYLTRKVSAIYNSHILFLCSSSDAVLIGKNQSYSKEKTKDNISPVRRDTRGETYFVDQGTRLFSFIDGEGAVFHKQNSFSILRHSINQLDLLGKTAEYQGDNLEKLCIEDKIISNSVVDFEQNAYRHQGALYIHTDKTKFEKYSALSQTKAKKVCTLTDINPNITSDSFDRAIISTFWQCYKSIDVFELNERNFSQFIDDKSLFMKIFTKYSSKEFKGSNHD